MPRVTKQAVKTALAKSLQPPKGKGKTLKILALNLWAQKPGESVYGYADYSIETRKAKYRRNILGLIRRGKRRRITTSETTEETWYGVGFECKLDKNNRPQACRLSGELSPDGPVGKVEPPPLHDVVRRVTFRPRRRE